MTATVRDDNVLRSHDDVRAALRSECDRLGARVTFARLSADSAGERHARYTVVLERFGRRPLSAASVYGVPCVASTMLEHVRTMVKGAATQAEKDK